MLSIVIPTYEQRGFGPAMLAKLLTTIRQQTTTRPFEVVVSDNSLNERVKDVVDSFSDLPITYWRNREFIGHCENFNFALDRINGTHVKLMCMDDVFMHRTSLDQFITGLRDHSWVVANSVHIDDNGHTKFKKTVQYDPNEFDKNITGMPSVIAYKACEVRFDVRLRTYCDLWLYRQLYDKYGMPGFIREYVVGQRFWRNSYSRIGVPQHEKDRQLIKTMLHDKGTQGLPGVRVDKINRLS